MGQVGRQAILLGTTLFFARLVGPADFGVFAQLLIFVTLTTLLLDQGLSTALISHENVSRTVLGASVTLNLALAAVVGLCTVLFAPAAATFFDTPELSYALLVLGPAVILRCLMIAPRVILIRAMDFKSIALAELVGAVIGSVVALLSLWWMASYWTLVVQIVVADLAFLAMLCWRARPPRPNLNLQLLKPSLGYSIRTFGSSLVSYSVQNADNVVVGREFGAAALAHYSLAYRVLTTPIQLVSQVVARVLFPAVSSARRSGRSIEGAVLKSIQGISLVVFPSMALAVVAAEPAVLLFLGTEWLPAVPLIQVLAISGARQAVTSINTPVMLGLGRADVVLRFSIGAAVVQISAIVVGAAWGPLGVAVGFTAAGFLLTPLIVLLQYRIGGTRPRVQFAAIVPALVCSAIGVLAYGLVAPQDASLWRVGAGALLGAGLYFVTLRVLFPKSWDFLRGRVA